MNIIESLQNAFPDSIIYVGEKLTNDEWKELGYPIPFVIIGETPEIVALQSFSEHDLALIDKKTGYVAIGNNTVDLGKFLLVYQYDTHLLYSRVEFSAKVEETPTEVFITEPTVSPQPEQVLKRTRRKKVKDSITEALKQLFPDFEIEKDENDIPFILAECSFHDLVEKIRNMTVGQRYEMLDSLGLLKWEDSNSEALKQLFPDFEIEKDENDIPFILAECSFYDLTEHFIEMGCLAKEVDGDYDQYTYSFEKQLFNVNYKPFDPLNYKVWLSQ